jgi:hypothetical protein
LAKVDAIAASRRAEVIGLDPHAAEHAHATIVSAHPIRLPIVQASTALILRRLADP